MIVFLKKAFAPKGGSISFCAAPQKKNLTFFQQTAAAAAPTLQKSARGQPKRRHLTKTARFVCVSVGVCDLGSF